MFDPNGALMYAMTAVVIAFVIAMSIRFIVMAWKRAREKGMDPKMLRRVAISSAIFTIAPAVSILLGVIALSRALGFPLPWLRLSVIGALTYETPAAASAAAAMGTDLSNLITDPVTFAAIAWVMTLGIIPGPVLVPTIGKKIENGVMRIRQKDEHWGSLFMTALFLGMISAFLGMIFATVSEGPARLDTLLRHDSLGAHHVRLRGVRQAAALEVDGGLCPAHKYAGRHGAEHPDNKSCQYDCGLRRDMS